MEQNARAKWRNVNICERVGLDGDSVIIEFEMDADDYRSFQAWELARMIPLNDLIYMAFIQGLELEGWVNPALERSTGCAPRVSEKPDNLDDDIPF